MMQRLWSMKPKFFGPQYCFSFANTYKNEAPGRKEDVILYNVICYLNSLDIYRHSFKAEWVSVTVD